MSDALDTTLWYGRVLIGRVKNAFHSDGTWFGVFERIVHPSDGDTARRVLAFIQFCEEWNERARDACPDPAEFVQYADIVDSGLWTTRDADGKPTAIDKAPVFFIGGDVTWVPV